ncbi:hypothetical protein [Dyadobacter chenhuakuii]|uniref:Lipoprotein n=1 Tax=Dyadobacter chenhuakuii TaxID=2909339 RepID=A0A9X1TRF3_9BACT|nr:hypothetical protein [Dyadobacter chenhuakuii]MCF2496900.1 hypothetical protein [Dyadobacter chenhuakuii]
MKKTILFALIWVSVMACDEKQNATPQPEPQSTSVPYRKQTKIAASGAGASGADLKVDLREVNDSRCPKDVVCIQMGSARIKLNVSDATNSTEVNVDFKGDAKADSQAFTLSGQNYMLTVSELQPYPVSTQTPKIEDYKVNVTIEKK